MIETVLYQALEQVGGLEMPPGMSSSGKKFEDFMVQQLYQPLREHGGLGVFPPRYTLRQATYSGVAHQFDIIVQETELTAIECKFRKRTGIDDLFAYLGKLKDYRQPPRGIFVTTAEKVNDDALCYAIAHQISIVCSCLAPVEYMLARVKSNSDLARRLRNLQDHLMGDNVCKQVLVQWQNEYRRFTAEGYC